MSPHRCGRVMNPHQASISHTVSLHLPQELSSSRLLCSHSPTPSAEGTDNMHEAVTSVCNNGVLLQVEWMVRQPSSFPFVTEGPLNPQKNRGGPTERRLYRPARNQRQCERAVPVWLYKPAAEGHDHTEGWKGKKKWSRVYYIFCAGSSLAKSCVREHRIAVKYTYWMDRNKGMCATVYDLSAANEVWIRYSESEGLAQALTLQTE